MAFSPAAAISSSTRAGRRLCLSVKARTAKVERPRMASSSSVMLSLPRPCAAAGGTSTYFLPTWLLPSYHRAFTSTPTCTQRHSTSTSTSTSTLASASASGSKTQQNEYAFPSHLDNPTPYDIFHFRSRIVTAAEIKARYYDLVRTLHPDRFISHITTDAKAKAKAKSKSQAEEEFKLIISAYNLLKDPRKKTLYDRAGLGWNSSKGITPSDIPPGAAGSDPWRNWKDTRYTRRYDSSYSTSGHDKFGWQNQSFYSSHQHASGPFAHSPGWKGGNGKYTSNGMFISSLFVLTWLLAGVQYSRLSLQSQKAIERADRIHLDAARSLHQARSEARSEEGKQRWLAFRRRAQEQKFLQEFNHHKADNSGQNLAIDSDPSESPYGVGHGGPSGKLAAQQRFAKAKAQGQTAQNDVPAQW